VRKQSRNQTREQTREQTQKPTLHSRTNPRIITLLGAALLYWLRIPGYPTGWLRPARIWNNHARKGHARKSQVHHLRNTNSEATTSADAIKSLNIQAIMCCDHLCTCVHGFYTVQLSILATGSYTVQFLIKPLTRAVRTFALSWLLRMGTLTRSARRFALSWLLRMWTLTRAARRFSLSWLLIIWRLSLGTTLRDCPSHRVCPSHTSLVSPMWSSILKGINTNTVQFI
jgi:hypothetical protein